MYYIDWQSNVVKRLCTSVAIVAGLVSVFLLRLISVWIFDIAVVFVVAVASWEIIKAKKLESRGVSFFYLVSYLFSAFAMYLLGTVTGFTWWLHLIIQTVVVFIFAIYTAVMNYMDKDFQKECTLKKVPLGKTATKTMGEFLKLVLYPTILLLLLIPLNHMGDFANATEILKNTVTGDDGKVDTTYSLGTSKVPVPLYATFGLVLVFAISCCTDSFAYVVGLTLRSPKMLPQKYRYISPNKSIAGGIGGLFGGVIASLSVLAFFTFDNTLVQQYLTESIGSAWQVELLFFAVGLVGSVMTQIGDIYASYIKRKANIKDYGTYLPGHGGAMDRLDGIAFNAIFIFFVFALILL